MGQRQLQARHSGEVLARSKYFATGKETGDASSGLSHSALPNNSDKSKPKRPSS